MAQLRLIRRKRFTRRRPPPHARPQPLPSPPRQLQTPTPQHPQCRLPPSPSPSQCGTTPNRSLWADPAPLPSYMLSPVTPPAMLGHHRPRPAPTQQLPYPSLSPIFQPNSGTFLLDELDLTLPQSPLTTLPTPPNPPMNEPYSNNQLNILNDICLEYPHLNYTYLYLQYAPLSYYLRTSNPL